MVEALLPGSSLRPLLADVSTAGLVALMKVEVNPQGETPAKEHAHYEVKDCGEANLSLEKMENVKNLCFNPDSSEGMRAPLRKAVCSRERNLWQVEGVRAGRGNTSVIDVDQDQVVCFLGTRSIADTLSNLARCFKCRRPQVKHNVQSRSAAFKRLTHS